jgi:hypothetical protein
MMNISARPALPGRATLHDVVCNEREKGKGTLRNQHNTIESVAFLSFSRASMSQNSASLKRFSFSFFLDRKLKDVREFVCVRVSELESCHLSEEEGGWEDGKCEERASAIAPGCALSPIFTLEPFPFVQKEKLHRVEFPTTSTGSIALPPYVPEQHKFTHKTSGTFLFLSLSYAAGRASFIPHRPPRPRQRARARRRG